jgi:hypothetical protein
VYPSDIPMLPAFPAFGIKNVYLEEHLPPQAPEAQRARTHHLISVAFNLDPSASRFERSSDKSPQVERRASLTPNSNSAIAVAAALGALGFAVDPSSGIVELSLF